MAIFGKLFTLIALLALVALINPTGQSYYHYAIDYPWMVSTESGIMALIGVVLVCIVMFFFWSAWRTTELMGKFIFFVLLGVACFLAYTTGIFNSRDYTSWFIIGVMYMFFFWGMFYPRLKYSLFKTRSVDDMDTE